jgi:uncharacterized protein
MQHMIDRSELVSAVRTRLAESPVTTLLGARQVGKTTLAHMVAETLPEVTFFDLERPAGRAALEKTPEFTLSDCRGLVVIDEIQRLPSLFEILRPLCDDPDRKATFLLLGSASPDLIRGVSETLAGRVLFLMVPGFSLSEIGAAKQNRLWMRGGFPRAFTATSDEMASRWIEGFAQTFLERDIPSLGLRIPADALHRFWAMLAHYHGQIWNAAELGRSMGANPGTVNHYRDVLAGTFMLRVLPPWHENLKKRQVKSPKVYLRDTGILHHFLRIGDLPQLRAHPRYGASWEGFALEQTLGRFGQSDAYFWATQRGAELDLLLMRQGKRWGFEFKCTDAPSTTKSMHTALTDLGLEHLWVLYPGKERYSLHDRITALPLSQLQEIDLRQEN